MKKTTITLALGIMLAGPAAFALTADDVVSDLQAQGYTRTEMQVGPSQIMVEAIRGTEKLEMILDKASGAVLKTKVDTVGAGDDVSPGVRIRERERDFARQGRRAGIADDDSDDAAGDDGNGEQDRDRDRDRDGSSAYDRDGPDEDGPDGDGPDGDGDTE